MVDMCPNTSMYDPSSLVTSFHNIPHVDIDLSPSPDNFELSLSYFQAVIIWACVPILCVVCLFILMAVYFICVCCCCCCQAHEKRSKASKGCCATLVILLVLFCLGMVGVAFWAEYELDQNILRSFDAARNATGIMDNLRNTTVSYNYDTDGAEMTLVRLRNGLQPESNSDDAEASAMVLIDLNQNLGTAFSDIEQQAIPINFGEGIDPAFAALDVFELARHWAVFAYLIVTVILLLLVALSVCFSACCKSPVCMVLMLIVFFFVTFIMWVAVGANLALLVVSGDVCFAPDTLIRNFTTQLNSTNAPISTELLDYYLICNQTCYSSPFQPLFDNATTAFVNVESNERVISDYLNNTPNTMLMMDLDTVVAHFDSAQSFLGEVEVLANCEPLNDEYLDVLADLCTNGYLFSVILFAMACGVAVFMMLIMICGSFYAGLLSRGREYDDETVVYDFPNSGSSPWDSYGTQQHYTANRREDFPLRESPQLLEGGVEPPKYTDLSQGPSYNHTGTNMGYSNGPQFADDGTVGVSIRPASGGDIDLGEPLDP